MESRASQFRVLTSRGPLAGNRDSVPTRLRDRPDISLFFSRSPAEASGRSLSLRIGPYILRGGGPVYELPLIDLSRRRSYLMFPRGTPLVPGDIFEIVRPLRARDGCTPGPGKVRKAVARVVVLGVDEKSRARVRVLSGSIRKGFWAERVHEDRLAAPRVFYLNVLRFLSILRPH